MFWPHLDVVIDVFLINTNFPDQYKKWNLTQNWLTQCGVKFVIHLAEIFAADRRRSRLVDKRRILKKFVRQLWHRMTDFAQSLLRNFSISCPHICRGRQAWLSSFYKFFFKFFFPPRTLEWNGMEWKIEFNTKKNTLEPNFSLGTFIINILVLQNQFMYLYVPFPCPGSRGAKKVQGEQSRSQVEQPPQYKKIITPTPPDPTPPRLVHTARPHDLSTRLSHRTCSPDSSIWLAH